ncbi:glycosyltransferase family 2 protein [Planococcus sp. 11815]|uniref:glycosyltransferase family 2 protein n=1 Tax=Planococcus sp. 11815 TaxID=2939413 RepID=UPI003DA21323
MYNISVLVPVFNEEPFIESLYHSLLKQKNISRQKVEVIFIDGDSTDNTLEKLNKLNENNTEFTIKILHNAKRYIASSLNVGLQASRGQYIIRLDVHSTIPEDYLSRIYDQLDKHSAEYCNFGGRTNAKGYDKTSSIVSKAVSNKWVIGGAEFRYSKKRIEVDTLFPGAWLREDLLKVGGWDEDWLINEDVELNCRLRKATHKTIVLDPDIVIDYFPRNTLKKLAKQYFNYGYWRIKTAKKHEESIRLSHLVPLVFLFMLVISILLAIVDTGLVSLFLLFNIVFYLAFLWVLSTKIFEKKEIFVGMSIIAVIQLTWILGAFKGYVVFGFPLNGYYNLIKKQFNGRGKFGRKGFT